MKRIAFVGICLIVSLPLFGQHYLLADSRLHFYSSAPIEDIEAISVKTRSLFDAKTGEIAFVVPIKTLEFENKRMQEHFNENYMESHKYPDATFKGRLSAFERNKAGVQRVMARGILNIHGVSREFTAEGTLEFRGAAVYLAARFPVRVADFNIKIPRVVFYNIAEVVDVHFNGKYLPHAAE
jgi:hypothetical protein